MNFSHRHNNNYSQYNATIEHDNESMMGSTMDITSMGHQDCSQICMVDAADQDHEIHDILEEEFNFEVVKSKNGRDITDTKYIIYMDYFEKDYFNYFHAQGFRIIGKSVVLWHYRDKSSLKIPKPLRPRYCYFFRDHKFFINTNLRQKRGETKELADLIHYMSGSVKKVFSKDCIMIADDVRGNEYRTAVAMVGDCRIMYPDWIRECWSQKDDLDFDCFDPQFINQFKIPCFGGLKIFCHGFVGGDLDKMKIQIRKNGGSWVNEYTKSTHAVFVDNTVNISILPFFDKTHSSNYHDVTSQWFWQSISTNYCANEGAYGMVSKKPLANSSVSRKRFSQGGKGQGEVKKNISYGSLEGTLNKSGSSCISDERMFSEDDLIENKTPVKMSKRQMVCQELLGTEENYVRCLEIIENDFNGEFERRMREGETIINAVQLRQIFSKVGDLLKVHTTIRDKLRSTVNNWSEKKSIGEIGDIYNHNSDKLKTVYRSYINNFDTACSTLKHCIETNEQFHITLKLVESKPELKRNTLKDLIIRPVQRMPSVVLLMKEILSKSKSEKNNKEYKSLEAAIPEMEMVVKETNTFLRETHDYTNTLEICNDIENLPAEIINSSRFVLKTFECLVIGATGSFWSQYVTKNIKMFFFNDIFVTAKMRSRFDNNRSMDVSFNKPRGLSRQSSFVNFFTTKPNKPYKYINYLFFPKIREVQFYHDANCAGLFIIKMRLQLSDDLIIVKPLNDTTSQGESQTFFKLLCDHISKSCRQFDMESIGPDDIDALEKLNPDEASLIRRAIQQTSHVRPFNPSTPGARPSGLRRALTSVSLNVSHTLSRMSSRTNLNSYQ
uniref:BRCT domain-containing protein n=1 Tax=Rhabditophanes sp. KR3021 TaxID=114890 RepID=A0AC35TT97_9BILA